MQHIVPSMAFVIAAGDNFSSRPAQALTQTLLSSFGVCCVAFAIGKVAIGKTSISNIVCYRADIAGTRTQPSIRGTCSCRDSFLSMRSRILAAPISLVSSVFLVVGCGRLTANFSVSIEMRRPAIVACIHKCASPLPACLTSNIIFLLARQCAAAWLSVPRCDVRRQRRRR